MPFRKASTLCDTGARLGTRHICQGCAPTGEARRTTRGRARRRHALDACHHTHRRGIHCWSGHPDLSAMADHLANAAQASRGAADRQPCSWFGSCAHCGRAGGRRAAAALCAGLKTEGRSGGGGCMVRVRVRVSLLQKKVQGPCTDTYAHPRFFTTHRRSCRHTPGSKAG